MISALHGRTPLLLKDFCNNYSWIWPRNNIILSVHTTHIEILCPFDQYKIKVYKPKYNCNWHLTYSWCYILPHPSTSRLGLYCVIMLGIEIKIKVPIDKGSLRSHLRHKPIWLGCVVEGGHHNSDIYYT